MNVKRNVMNAEQGAATTVWAASGKYLERCAVSRPYKEGFDVRYDGLEPGFAPFTYDETAAKRLWDVSMEIIGMNHGV